ncbi:MAG: NADH:ubiquinone reductase (Na(+)-transporting) subunit C [Bacteroidetes bacterium]|nr:NADH:ubiquinone reductase (Na(+)-transporting) subunit C [Bacteroidota bacterium]
MHSNSYTFFYAAAITVITGVLLALASEGLRPAIEGNVALEKKKNILSSVLLRPEGRQEIESLYSGKIKGIVLDNGGNPIEENEPFGIVLKEELEKEPDERKLPLYIYSEDDGRKYYIVPMYGAGLWGPIWGYISLREDFNTIYGAYFDHKGETPGLGAEISSYEKFQQQFEGKKIFDTENNFISVRVVKKGIKTDFAGENKVDGISGGTITSNGTDKMIHTWLEQYVPYIKSRIQNTNPQ